MKYRWILVTTPAYNERFGVVIAKSHRWFPTFDRCTRNATKYYRNQIKIEGEEQKPLFAIESKEDGYHQVDKDMQGGSKNKKSFCRSVSQ